MHHRTVEPARTEGLYVGRAVRGRHAAGPSAAELDGNYQVGARLGSNNKRVIMRP